MARRAELGSRCPGQRAQHWVVASRGMRQEKVVSERGLCRVGLSEE